jgi:hypothetical protein
MGAEAEERAAIAEFDGGVPRRYAFAFGLLQTEQPASFDEPHWRQMIDDAGRFLDCWGAEAERSGWRPVDLFGTEPPGLLRVLAGRDVVALDRVAARLSDGRCIHRPQQRCGRAPQ